MLSRNGQLGIPIKVIYWSAKLPRIRICLGVKVQLRERYLSPYHPISLHFSSDS